MLDKIYNVFCGDDCKGEGMTREQILAAIAEATGVVPSGGDEAFVSKIKDVLTNGSLQFATCTQAEYNLLATEGQIQPNTLYIITDESEGNDLSEIYTDIENLKKNVDYLQNEVATLYATEGDGFLLNALEVNEENKLDERNTRMHRVSRYSSGAPEIDDFTAIREPVLFDCVGGWILTLIESSPVNGRRWQYSSSVGYWEIISSPPVLLYENRIESGGIAPTPIGTEISLAGKGAKYYTNFCADYSYCKIPFPMLATAHEVNGRANRKIDRYQSIDTNIVNGGFSRLNVSMTADETFKILSRVDSDGYTHEDGQGFYRLYGIS